MLLTRSVSVCVCVLFFLSFFVSGASPQHHLEIHDASDFNSDIRHIRIFPPPFLKYLVKTHFISRNFQKQRKRGQNVEIAFNNCSPLFPLGVKNFFFSIISTTDGSTLYRAEDFFESGALIS